MPAVWGCRVGPEVWLDAFSLGPSRPAVSVKTVLANSVTVMMKQEKGLDTSSATATTATTTAAAAVATATARCALMYGVSLLGSLARVCLLLHPDVMHQLGQRTWAVLVRECIVSAAILVQVSSLPTSPARFSKCAGGAASGQRCGLTPFSSDRRGLLSQ